MSPKRILVADDEPTLVELLKMRLRASGFEVLTAADGPSALEVARRERPDLTLLDIMLPKIDGFRVCKMLKVDQRYKDLKIVFFTAKAAQEAMAMAQAAGGDGYITKDTDGAQIVEIIRKMLEPGPAARK